ncbi:MAG: TTT family transporter substrate-binding component [Roseibaca calidilacus]|uniref:TTT family transporter substrate-binding component n=1 Tax=Roseibaca calidilacus TaxID=1666912 RepID=A0A0P8A5Y6_9RHOB|nr:tripartite tricarboxylate transporter substrate-binding protein [Roseibaca calidilacus]KPP89520.1 MAG: TTT family transporter substrate-binding component [Roseibaca calidilacus]CUX79398.1 putative tricarboxylic transport membrane protein [Roseibaca calidilacus]
MNTFGWTRRAVIAAATATVALGGAVQAQAEQMMDAVHFLIPGGAGGGWDGTARGTGEALVNSGLVDNATFENLSGGGGGVAIANLIENAESSHGTLMVNSTPIVIRALTGEISQSFRDLTMVAGTVGDYAALVVTADSPLQSMEDALASYREAPMDFAIGGGSVPGGMDHLVAAIVMQGAGEDPTAFNYIGYDAGGEAMAGLLSGEIDALSTGFSEAIALAEQGEVRILGVTAPERVPAYDAAPTFAEQGIEAEFVNWRGFFAAPGLPEEQLTAYQDMLATMMETPEWEAVRARMGLVNIYRPGDDFTAFLETQEKQLGDLMRDLGFL